MLKVVISKIVYYPPSKGYAVLLKDTQSERFLPIIIGTPEAQAIALALEKAKPPRPMTHDLCANLLQAFNIKLEKIVVSDLIEGTFYAKLYLKLPDGGSLEMDARPSDAIAIALRLKADLFVENEVMIEAGQYLSAEKPPATTPEENIPEIQRLERLFELQNQLQEAIKEENYELAAQLRDEIEAIQKDLTIN